MKKILHPFALLLVWCLALAGGHEARASHAQAGELTYFSLGNNQYRVRVTFFKDCGGIPAPINFQLSCRSGGCNGTAVTAVLLPPTGFPTSPGSFTTFQPYCPSVAATVPLCNPNSSNTGPTNTISINYEGTVTLPPAAEWVLSVEESARPTVANITGGTLRLEATLNNSITPFGGGAAVTLENNSPQFNRQTLPVPFVCWKQSSTLSFSATDVDRLNFPRPGAVGQPDSLVYTLDRPLNGCGTYETYSAYPSGTCVPTVIGGTCILTCPPSAGSTYSAALPIAVGNDTIGTCVPGTISTLSVRPRFTFNAQAGSFRFTPALYSTTLSNNKYAVVGKVTEYRKINGRYYKVGSVRRDFLVIVIDCGTNIVPSPPSGSVADTLSRPIIVNNPDTLQLNVRSCNYTRITVPFTDPDNITTPTHAAVSPLQLLTVFAPADINSNLLQSGDIGNFVLTRNGTPNPVGTFYFQPSSTAVGTRILITMRIEDNACPAKGIQYRSIVINIISGQQAKAIASATGAVKNATICPGTSIDLRGVASRPDSVRSVATGRTILQTYNYQWSLVNPSAAPTAGFPAIANTQTITVRPIIATRYRLEIVPRLGFAQGCRDTTSFLVRVAPKDSARFVITDSISSRPVVPGKPAGSAVPPITYRFKNLSFLSFGLPLSNGRPNYTYDSKVDASSGFKIDSVTWTYRQITNSKGQQLSNSPVVFARTRNETQDPGPLKLSECGDYIIEMQSSAFQTAGVTTATKLSCPVARATAHVKVPCINVYNIITPNGDNLNDTFVVGPELQGGKLEIYNRWGRKVADYSNYQNDWGAQDQAPGVYYYLLTSPGGDARKGWVEVIK